MPIIQKQFYMIRHGQTEANAARIMAGSLDSPLTQLGRDQARTARLAIENLDIKPRFITHSHLSRARETAEIINENLKLPMIEDKDLAEIHVGEWEGLPYDDIQDAFRTWETAPEGESMDEFFARLKRGKNKALNDKRHPPLIVCHGGVFRAFAKFYGIDTWGVRNCDLHSFAPKTKEQDFPWEVHRIHHQDKTLIRQLADSFHDPQNLPSEFLKKS